MTIKIEIPDRLLDLWERTLDLLDPGSQAELDALTQRLATKAETIMDAVDAAQKE